MSSEKIIHFHSTGKYISIQVNYCYSVPASAAKQGYRQLQLEQNAASCLIPATEKQCQMRKFVREHVFS